MSIGVAAAFVASPDDAFAQSAQQVAQEVRADAPATGVSGDATFERLLQDPMNAALNLQYAREQIAAGDLKEASTALDRVLLMEPDLHDVRALYGMVLFRLQMYERAEYELENALEGGVNPKLQPEIEAYLKQIKRYTSKSRASVTLAFGADYDTNRNQAPLDGQALFIGIPIDAQPENGDFAILSSASLGWVYDPDTQAGHTLQGDTLLYRSDKLEEDTLDLEALISSVNWTHKFNWSFPASWTFGPRVTYLRLDGERYMYSFGAELTLASRPTPATHTYLTLRGEHENFSPLDTAKTSANRDGHRLSARTGASWAFSQSQADQGRGLRPRQELAGRVPRASAVMAAIFSTPGSRAAALSQPSPAGSSGPTITRPIPS